MHANVLPPPARFNFAWHLIDLNAARSAKTALTDDLGSLRYGELAEQVQRMAAGLQSLGLRREDRVFLLMHDSCDWVVAFLGALYAGVVPVALNTLLTAEDYAFMLDHSRAQAALVSGALLPTLQAAMSQGPHELKALVVARPAAALPEGAVDFAALVFWLYSSGSTGTPKGTVHLHSHPIQTAELYARPILGIRETDVVYSAAKLFFAYGLGNGLTFPMSVGATAVLLPSRPTPGDVFKVLRQYQPTIFYGVPTLYAALLADAGRPARADLNLRVCTSAGEALPAEIGRKWTAEYGCEILDGIGSTEMLHIFLSNRPGAVRYGTTGQAVPGYDLRIVGDDGRECGVGEIGELQISGPSAALMYWNNRAKTKATFCGEWTRSGDKYTRDADGYYTYGGRSDDMLKVGGIYVSPFEVEASLMTHSAVLEAAVIGVADTDELVKPKAYVVLKAGQAVTAEDLKAHVKHQLAPYKYPRWIEFVTELPKTATGKIQRFKLRRRDFGAAGPRSRASECPAGCLAAGCPDVPPHAVAAGLSSAEAGGSRGSDV
jgi:benzoate-CoA ligase